MRAINDVMRAKVSEAIAGCDQQALDELGFLMVWAGCDVDEVAQLLNETLNAAQHDIQMWWQGTCNCDGHLN